MMFTELLYGKYKFYLFFMNDFINYEALNEIKL